MTTFTAEGAVLEKSTKSPQVTLECDTSTSEDNELSSQTDDNFCESNECLSQATCHSSQAVHHSCKDAPPFLLDFTAAPDLAQTFVVTCALLSRPFHFKGLESLRIKETNRIAALIAELQKLGKHIEAIGEGELRYTAQDDSPHAQAITIATYDDHRMALAFAPAALLFPQLSIEHPEVVAKSYPHYWRDLSELH